MSLCGRRHRRGRGPTARTFGPGSRPRLPWGQSGAGDLVVRQHGQTLEHRRPLAESAGVTGPGRRGSISPDERSFASSSSAGQVRTWDLLWNRLPAKGRHRKCHPTARSSLGRSPTVPDGSRLAGRRRSAFWNLEPDDRPAGQGIDADAAIRRHLARLESGRSLPRRRQRRRQQYARRHDRHLDLINPPAKGGEVAVNVPACRFA